MARTLVLGAIVGGLIAFAWSAVSWMLLSWHADTLLRFADENRVAEVVRENAADSGMYMLPNGHAEIPGDPEGEARIMSEAEARMRQGPFLFMSVARDGVDPTSPLPYAATLAGNIAAAFVVMWLLMQTSGLSYLGRVVFVVAIAITAALLTHLPYWAWWRFPPAYTLVQVADLMISWLLAGFALAALARPRRGMFSS